MKQPVQGSQRARHPKQRAYAPKTKTGCGKCKAAHVRCDEQRPTCGRCQRHWLACVYIAVAPNRGKLAKAEQQLFQVQPVRLVEPSGTSMRHRDVPYFDAFRHHVNAYRVLGYGQGEFWRRTVLRESARDDCVRSSIIALGALARAQEMRSSVELPPSTNQSNPLTAFDDSSLHYYQALLHHTKAIAALRERIALSKHIGSSGHRAILIATTLLISFEFLQGNTEAADQLAAHCLSSLSKTILRGSLNRNGTGHPSIAVSLDDEGVHEAEIELVRTTCCNAAFSDLYPRAREVIFGLPVPSVDGCEPPSESDRFDVFLTQWTRCLTLVSLWSFRLKMMMSNPRQEAGVNRSRSLPLAFEAEQQMVLGLLHCWKESVQGRMAEATMEERGEYRRIALTIEGCQHSIRTIFGSDIGQSDDNIKTEPPQSLDNREAFMLTHVPTLKDIVRLRRGGAGFGSALMLEVQVVQGRGPSEPPAKGRRIGSSISLSTLLHLWPRAQVSVVYDSPLSLLTGLISDLQITTERENKEDGVMNEREQLMSQLYSLHR